MRSGAIDIHGRARGAGGVGGAPVLERDRGVHAPDPAASKRLSRRPGGAPRRRDEDGRAGARAGRRGNLARVRSPTLGATRAERRAERTDLVLRVLQRERRAHESLALDRGARLPELDFGLKLAHALVVIRAVRKRLDVEGRYAVLPARRAHRDPLRTGSVRGSVPASPIASTSARTIPAMPRSSPTANAVLSPMPVQPIRFLP